MTRQPGFGTFRQGATTPTLVFERRLLVPVTRAWQLITDPGALAIWLRANADIEPRAGGAVRLQFTNSPSIVHGVVQRYDPPHALAYTWPDAQGRSSLVTIELFADGPDATRLVLTHALD
ncbi:MAG TPA: SRPBCC domain-containing protein, partial [Roseiflexaceae bacterium]|nr:SRPBCC domain-containing protein [Roseiflexaceae bacterium]